MTQQKQIDRVVQDRREIQTPRTDEAERAAEAEAERQRLRAVRDRLLDTVLDEPAGETEVIGAAGDRPQVRDRAQANEEYVRTFKQQGGE